jgi:putative RNA 2'-phosphotransferase
MHKGLLKMNRHQVHLSSSKDTALKVGQRKGKPVILKIDALKMYHLGFSFFVSPNNGWLTHHVPAIYMNVESKDAL